MVIIPGRVRDVIRDEGNVFRRADFGLHGCTVVVWCRIRVGIGVVLPWALRRGQVRICWR